MQVQKTWYMWKRLFLQSFYKNRKYLANITDESVITCDKIIDAEAKSHDEETVIVPTNFDKIF